MTDSRPGFRGLVSDPTQLTEGEPGCMFLLEGVTNPAESPLVDSHESVGTATGATGTRDDVYLYRS